jgi:hypothetical protein
MHCLAIGHSDELQGKEVSFLSWLQSKGSLKPSNAPRTDIDAPVGSAVDGAVESAVDIATDQTSESSSPYPCVDLPDVTLQAAQRAEPRPRGRPPGLSAKQARGASPSIGRREQRKVSDPGHAKYIR